jgi:hypothetical protein
MIDHDINADTEPEIKENERFGKDRARDTVEVLDPNCARKLKLVVADYEAMLKVEITE